MGAHFSDSRAWLCQESCADKKILASPKEGSQAKEGLPIFACLVLDRQHLVGQAVGGLLAEHCGLNLTGVFTSVTQAIVFIENSPPDLLLLDVHLENNHSEDWFEVARALQHANPDGRVILFNSLGARFTTPEDIKPIVIGVLDKNSDWDELLKIVIHMQEDSPNRSAMSNPRWRLRLHEMSPRELRVFRALGRGLLNKEIAQSLGLSLHTVETYRKHISAKLLLSGSELVRAATLNRCTDPFADRPVTPSPGSRIDPGHLGRQH